MRQRSRRSRRFRRSARRARARRARTRAGRENPSSLFRKGPAGGGVGAAQWGSAPPPPTMGMEEYETVRKLPQKGGFGEIFIVRKKAESGGGKGSPTFILKRARLA